MTDEPKKSDPPASDVRLASETDVAAERNFESQTADAPSFPAPLPPMPKSMGTHGATVPFERNERKPENVLEKGERIDDFEVEVVLGRGAFGVVYLARQLSLDRRVALKVTSVSGSEGRTMARLEHEHIVQVFSETIDSTGKLQMLCMQLVPGAPVDDVIHDLSDIRRARGHWTGADVLASVDSRSKVDDVFDSAALRNREALAKMDDLEATCWIAARLAEGVDYAHKRGVLHRDIKPANVLMDRYGRPLLADFNISFQSLDTKSSITDRFGGTLAYMAPEHLDAFHPSTDTPADAVDARSDIYSLGIVIHELLTGKFPLAAPPRADNPIKNIERYSAVRSLSAPDVIGGAGNARKAFSYIVSRCLDPDPDKRFQSGAELAKALDGCRQLREYERANWVDSWLVRSVKLFPILWVVLFTFLPQVLGSIFNVSYNVYEIVGHRLNETQQQFFWDKLLPWYNGIVYPAALAAIALLVWPVARAWRELRGKRTVDPERLAWARRRALRLPVWLITIAALGWIPGGFIFPAMIDRFTGPIDSSLYGHFIASFTISGMIAVAYSLCGLQYAMLRGLYTRMWPRAEEFLETVGPELSATRWRLWLTLGLAGMIPLFAAVLLVFFTTDLGIGFKLLTIGMIIAGGGGFLFTWEVTKRMSKLIDSASTLVEIESRADARED